MPELPDFTAEQWASVRQRHEQFATSPILDRPLLPRLDATILPDVNWEDFPRDELVFAGPRERDETLDPALRYWVASAWAISQSQYAYDAYPHLYIAREFFGHSQRLAEPFGTTTVVEGSIAAQAHPSIHDFSEVASLKLKPTKDCPWLSRGREVLRYFVESTQGRYHIPHMVTTGPSDTVNYATGSTLFLEGLYTNPKEVHQLLQMATDVIIEDILACQEIAGDKLVSDHTYLLDGCFCICSEIRSQFSGEHYEEFEAPYLKQISDAVGPLHIHVSGPIEQSIPGVLKDPAIKHLKFWLKDCDLQTVVDMIGSQVSFDLFRNTAMPRLDFESEAAFFQHIFQCVKPETRWTVPFYAPQSWNTAYDACEAAGTLPDSVRNFGRFAE